jgi:adenine-specific DNA-methyltransferase
VIKYIGSKRTLVPRIVSLAEAIRARTGARTICDLFTGTTRVAQGFKRAAFQVMANDCATYSEILSRAFIETDGRNVQRAALDEKCAYLNSLPGIDGYITKTFCEDARYFQPFNGRRMDAIRPEIDRIAESETERAILLTSLLLAADKVDSTTGLQMAYLKSWSPRSHNILQLQQPALIDGGGSATRADANVLCGTMGSVDIAYIDPPYNQHSYHSNYHIWETIVRNDTPVAYGIARKREDCREVKSDYNAKGRAWSAFSRLIHSVPATHLVVSFNNEGFFAYDAIVALLEEVRGEVAVVPVEFRRYVGAKIGIHNLRGEKVGRVSHVTNREFLFVAGAGADAIVRAAAQPAASGTRD